MDTDLDRFFRLYLRWLQWLCLVAVLWVAIQPRGVVLTLPVGPAWTLYIGGAILALYDGMGRGIALPVSIWPLIIGAAGTAQVMDRVRRQVTRDG